MNSSLQLIILTPGFPADESDTSCIPALQDFVLGLKEEYPEVAIRVIAFQYPHIGKTYTWNDIPVYAAGGKDRAGIFRIITWMKVLFQLLLIKRNNNTFIISYFLTEATYIGQLFSRFSGVKQIAIAAGQDVRKENPYLQRINFEKLTVITFNEKMSSELQHNTGKKSDDVIPMGIRVNQKRQELQENRTIDIMIAGSLIPLKQVDKAVKLIAELKKEFPRIRSVIVGSGSEQVALENLADEFDLGSAISFTGALSRVDVLEKMKVSKILLHTSAYEGQSTVITEALSCGMHVVCFDVGRITDHQKIKVCMSETDMLNELRKLMYHPQLDFSPAIPITMSETVKAYRKIISAIGIVS